MSVNQNLNKLLSESIDPIKLKQNLSPNSIKYQSALTDDFISLSGVSFETGFNKVALFANPYKESLHEALVINLAGKLVYLKRNNNGGKTGFEQDGKWDVEIIHAATNFNFKEVVVVRHPQGSLWAFCIDSANTLKLFELINPEHWRLSNLPQGLDANNWHHLYLQYSTETPLLMASISGIDSIEGKKLKNVISNYQGWAPGAVLDTKLANCNNFVCGYNSISSDNTFHFYNLDSSKNLHHIVFEKDGKIKESEIIANNVLQLIGSFHNDAGLCCVYLKQYVGTLDNKKYPEFFYPYTGKVKGGNAVPLKLDVELNTAKIWQDVNGMLHFYGLAFDAEKQSNVIRVMHQKSWVSINFVNNSARAKWEERTDGSAITTPIMSRVEQFFISKKPDIYPTQLVKHIGNNPLNTHVLYSQDVTTNWQVRENISVTSTNTFVSKRYIVDVSLLNGYEAVVPNYSVELSASSLTDIQIFNSFYVIGPDKKVSIKTNNIGKVNFRILADDICPPTIHINAQGLNQGVSINPAEPIHSFLAGNKPLLNHQDGFTAQTLQNAKVNGQPLVPNWDNKPTPEQFVQTCRDVLENYATGTGLLEPRIIQGYAEPQKIVGFSIQVGAANQPAYQAFLTREDLDVHINNSLTASSVIYTGASIADALADFWQSILNGLTKITNFIFDAANSVARFFVDIGNGVKKVFEFICDTIENAVKSVGAFFTMVGAEIKKVIEWLSWLFNFEDVWIAKDFFSSGLVQLPQMLKDFSAYYKDLEHNWFIEKEQEVRDLISFLKIQLFNLTPASIGYQAEQLIPKGGPSVDRYTEHVNNPHVKYFSTLVLENSKLNEAIMTSFSQNTAPLETAFDNLAHILESSHAGQTLIAGVEGLLEPFANIFDYENPDVFLQALLNKFIDLFESIIIAALELADTVVQVILEIINLMGDLLLTFLNTELPYVPGLTEIFNLIRQDSTPITFNTLAGVLVAYPSVVMHKIITGKRPFAPGDKLPTLYSPWHQNYASQGVVAIPPGWCFAAQITCNFAWVAYAAIDAAYDVAAVKSEYTLPQPVAIAVAAVENWSFGFATLPFFYGPFDDSNRFRDDNILNWISWASWELMYMFDLFGAIKPENAFSKKYGTTVGNLGICPVLGIFQFIILSVQFSNSDQTDLDKYMFASNIMGCFSTVFSPILREIIGKVKEPDTQAVLAGVSVAVGAFAGDAVAGVMSLVNSGIGAVGFKAEFTTVFEFEAGKVTSHDMSTDLKTTGGWGSFSFGVTGAQKAKLPYYFMEYLDKDKSLDFYWFRDNALTGDPGGDAVGEHEFEISVRDTNAPPSVNLNVPIIKVKVTPAKTMTVYFHRVLTFAPGDVGQRYYLDNQVIISSYTGALSFGVTGDVYRNSMPTFLQSTLEKDPSLDVYLFKDNFIISKADVTDVGDYSFNVFVRDATGPIANVVEMKVEVVPSLVTMTGSIPRTFTFAYGEPGQSYLLAVEVQVTGNTGPVILFGVKGDVYRNSMPSFLQSTLEKDSVIDVYWFKNNIVTTIANDTDVGNYSVNIFARDAIGGVSGDIEMKIQIV